jgi:hypothetical protein
MPAWWTYTAFKPDSDLEQGDFLGPTEELGQVLAAVHPHFRDSKYVGFLIASQSCDLVRRNGEAGNAQYISIATVRPLRVVLTKLIASIQEPFAPGLFKKGTKFEAKKLLSRILNQNEQALGLFYLHPDTDLKLGEPAVAFLRVTVSLRMEHYSVLMKSRTGRLAAAFQAKLGWLLGNLYARAATPDWYDRPNGKKELEKAVDDLLADPIPGVTPEWIDDELVQVAREQQFDHKGKTPAEIVAALEPMRPLPPMTRAVDTIAAELRELTSMESDVLEKLRKRLENNSTFRSLIRR